MNVAHVHFTTGFIRTQPASWNEFLFAVVHNLAGT
jgi:hypothetical protein